MHIRRLLDGLSQDVIPSELTGVLPPLISALESIRVNTVESFLYTAPATLWDALQAKDVKGQGPTLLTPASYSCLRQRALAALVKSDSGLGISAQSAAQAWEQERQQALDAHWDGFGISGLDGLLDGIEASAVIELAGGRGAGKSLLALHAVLRHLIVDPSQCCVWIDTEAAFSAVRAAGILGRMGVSDIESVLLRIQVIPCFDVSTLSEIIRAVQEDLEMGLEPAAQPEPETYKPEPAAPTQQQDLVVPTSQAVEVELDLSRPVLSPPAGIITEDDTPAATISVGVIVVDSITPLLAPLINSNSSENQARASRVMSSLLTLTRRHSLLTLVANGTSPLIYYNPMTRQSRTTAPSLPSVFGSTTVRPALKTGFEYWADVTLLVQKEMDILAGDPTDGNKGGLIPTWQSQMSSSQAPGGSQMANTGRPQTSKRVIEVLKNRYGPSSTWTTFDVTA